MPTLSVLKLQENFISGTIPDFSYLPNLATLYAGSNNLTGTVIDFTNTPFLTDLQLSDNQLTFLPSLKNLPRLQTLVLKSNYLRQPFPDLSRCPYLENLILNENHFYGSVPYIQNLHMKGLYLSDNSFSGSLPHLSHMTELTIVDFSFNEFTGQIPFDYGYFTGLQSISFAFNALSGFISNEFWNLGSLESIDLSYNQFEGDLFKFICPDTCYLNSYSTLKVAGNQLNGPLIGAIFDLMPSLKTLDFSNNRITSLGELSVVHSLTSMDISRNPLTGPIPNTYESFYLMDYLNVTSSHLNHGNMTLLPSFMVKSNNYLLKNEEDKYLCPTLSSKISPLVSYYVDADYYDFEFCKCLPDYFGYAGNCLKCPPECDCSTSNQIVYCYASPSVTEIQVITPCPDLNSCIMEISSEGATTNGCIEGYEGRVCSKCQEGYGKLGRSCKKCDEKASIAIIVLACWGYIWFAFYTFRATPRASGKMKIFLFHIQTLSILWNSIQSTALNQLIDIASSVGSGSFPTLSCIFESTSATTIVLFSVIRIPIIVAIGVSGFFISRGTSRDKVIYVALLCLHMLYYGVSRDVFSSIGCTLHDSGFDKTYLNAFPWISCESSNSEFTDLVKMAVPFLVFYVVALPILFYYILRQNANSYDDPMIYQRYGFLFINYHHDYYYWDLIILARRTSLALVTTVIPYTEKAALYITLFLIFQLSIWLQHRYNPYKTDEENIAEISSLYLIYFSFFGGLITTFVPNLDWLKILILVANIIFIGGFVCIGFGVSAFKSLMRKTSPVSVITTGNNPGTQTQTQTTPPQPQPTTTSSSSQSPKKYQAPSAASPDESNPPQSSGFVVQQMSNNADGVAKEDV